MIFIHLWCFASDNINIKIICTFVIPAMTRNMVDLTDEILTKIRKKYNNFKIAEIRDHIKEVSEALEKVI